MSCPVVVNNKKCFLMHLKKKTLRCVHWSPCRKEHLPRSRDLLISGFVSSSCTLTTTSRERRDEGTVVLVLLFFSLIVVVINLYFNQEYRNNVSQFSFKFHTTFVLKCKIGSLCMSSVVVESPHFPHPPPGLCYLGDNFRGSFSIVSFFSLS